jgi:hypothetical protein
LKKFGVDLQGDANVVWARNEGHSVKYARDVYEELAGETTREGVEKVLRGWGKKLGPPETTA